MTDIQICTSEKQSYFCKNMLPVENDLDLEFEHYFCKLCRRKMKLCYEDMK